MSEQGPEAISEVMNAFPVLPHLEVRQIVLSRGSSNNSRRAERTQE
jgi:hypothetical protein